jgi:D-sedoheptulose 7-phosphate isomerase
LRKISINIKNIINEHILTANNLLDHIDLIEDICSLSLTTIQQGNTILLCGNGGSASDSIHISSELVGKFEKERRALPSISLSSNSSNLTAIANDFGFEHIFSRQIEAIGKKGDLLIAISTSGNSKNIINAIHCARSNGLNVVAFTGKDGGKINEMDCMTLKVPNNNVARIQEMHILVGHIISKYIEENI